MDKCEKVPKLQRFRSEEEFAQTWDRCITDMIVKMGGGLGLGIVFSLFLFGRRGWPIYFGMGSGFGIAYNNCQGAFSGTLQTHQLRQRCSSHIQLAKRRCEKIQDPCKRATVTCPTVTCPTVACPPVCPSVACPPVAAAVLECMEPQKLPQVPPCNDSKREEPWTAHNTYGQVTDQGINNSTDPHFNIVDHSQQAVPPCPDDSPPTCETSCSFNPRDSCRFKERM